MRGFLEFIRKQGVVGLAVGFILGGAVSNLVAALVKDLITPLIGILLGVAGNFQNAVLTIGPAKLLIGDFFNILINFVVVAIVVYVGVTKLKLDRLDIKEEKK